MKITIYDGTHTIGGNKIYVEDRGEGIFLDFGLNFAKYGEFYQEYPTERAIPEWFERNFENVVTMNDGGEFEIQ